MEPKAMEPEVVAATSSRVECRLVENVPLRLVGAKGRRVQCVSGVAWITAYGQRTDVFLRPGHVYEIPNGGLVLAEAIGDCTIRVDLPGSFDQAGRWPAMAGAGAPQAQTGLLIPRLPTARRPMRPGPSPPPPAARRRASDLRPWSAWQLHA